MLEALRSLEGRPVCVHASMRSFPAPRPSADLLIDALLDAGCTIIAPTFTDDMAQPPGPGRRVPRNGWNYDTYTLVEHERRFDAASNTLSVESMGVFAQRLLHRSGRVRGDHPLCSFSGVGPLAERLVGAQRPLNVFAPLDALCRHDGAILLLGTDLTSMTLIHLAEADAGRTPFRRWSRDGSGAVAPCEVGGCSEAFGKLEPRLTGTEHRVEGSRWRIFGARDARQAAAEAIRLDPAVTHCRRPTCQRCEDAMAGGPIL